MTRFLISAALWAALTSAAYAECFADYKAKQDDPLRLHYGVAQINSCSKSKAKAELSKRLKKNGWTLLNIVSVFEDSGLEKRKSNAGRFYLRF